MHRGWQVAREEEAERVVMDAYLLESAWSLRIWLTSWGIPFLSVIGPGTNFQNVRSVDWVVHSAQCAWKGFFIFTSTVSLIPKDSMAIFSSKIVKWITPESSAPELVDV